MSKCQYIWEGKNCELEAIYRAGIIQTGQVDYKVCIFHALKLSEFNREYTEVTFKEIEA